jgi:hypothetical protein
MYQTDKALLTQAIDNAYKDLQLNEMDFNTEEEYYEIQLTHTKSNRQISIALRDSQRQRDFDIIPLHAKNAPLGLIEIFTTFLHVFWHAKDNNNTMEESLIELINDDQDEEEEKLVQ